MAGSVRGGPTAHRNTASPTPGDSPPVGSSIGGHSTMTEEEGSEAAPEDESSSELEDMFSSSPTTKSAVGAASFGERTASLSLARNNNILHEQSHS